MRYVLDASVALRWCPAEEQDETAESVRVRVVEEPALFAALGLTGCDAMYAALAEELGACWLTFDAQAHARIASEGLSFDLGRGLPESWTAAPAQLDRMHDRTP